MSIIRALAFGSGAYNSIGQLGCTHALLVIRGKPPDICAGISIGAVNAAVVAEVISQQDDNQRITRFRSILNAALGSTDKIAGSFMPDRNEIASCKPLPEHSSSIKFKDEQEDAKQLADKRFHIARLIHDTLSLHISLKTAVNVAEQYMALRDDRRFWPKLKAFLKLSIWMIPFNVEFFRFALPAIVFGPGRDFTLNIMGKIIKFLIGSIGIIFGFLSPIALLLSAMWELRKKIRPTSSQEKTPFDSLLKKAFNRFLDYYWIKDSIGHAYPLKQILVECFDVNYYGKKDVNEVLKCALKAKALESKNPTKKKLEDYKETKLVIFAAKLESGAIEAFEATESVVDALLAANAVMPIFPAVKLGGKSYIDAANISDEPMLSLINYLREKEKVFNADKLYIYPFSPLPIEDASFPRKNEAFLGVASTLQRVLELLKFKNTKMERNMVKEYSSYLDPSGGMIQEIKNTKYVRADVFPIDGEGIDTNWLLLKASSREERNKILLEAVADGCRESMQAFIGPELQTKYGRVYVQCAKALKELNIEPLGIPGPGISEVCQHCCLYRNTNTSQPATLNLTKTKSYPPWPREGSKSHNKTSTQPETVRSNKNKENGKPTLSLLFNGGVFRGVFQIGVVAALSEMNCKPALIAGASVGSITSAIIARHFQIEMNERKRHLQCLAAAYLSLNRIIPTSSFHDLVQRFAGRARESDVSPRDFYRVLLNNEQRSIEQREIEERRVSAVCSQLFNLNSLETHELVTAFQHRDSEELSRKLSKAVGRFLQLHGVQDEILGSSPIAFLINSLAVEYPSTKPFINGYDHKNAGTAPKLISTVTNMQNGRLELLGGSDDINILEALLASSAYPVIFRPRFKWEVKQGANENERYVDGGTMDNLPLEPVINYLKGEISAGNISGEPFSPHLLVATSLEVTATSLNADTAKNWIEMLSLASQFTANKKIDDYSRFYNEIRDIYEAKSKSTHAQPIKIDIIAIKPKWLCGTYSFTESLGFSEQKYAANIAHACAMTFKTFSETLSPEAMLALEISDPEIDADLANPKDSFRKDGKCHFRKSAPCPFYCGSSSDEIGQAVSEIYTECGRQGTHVNGS